MSDAVCSERVRSGDRWHPKHCSKPVTVERDGKPYCTIHDPERVAKRTEGRMAAWRAKWDENERIARIKAAAPEMLTLLKKIYDTGYGMREHTETEALIAKAEGRQP